jgi:ABC-type Mn2+/Zn2+ transport system ATPase subunit
MSQAEGPSPLFEARALRACYGRREVFRDLDLTIRPGEFWVVLGPNGAGKTTLLKLLLGSLRPRAGTVRRRTDLAAGGASLVPQHASLAATLPTTVRECVLSGLVGLGLAGEERRHRLAWALARVALGGREREDFWTLSGGTRQRVLVARALVRRPRLLVLDEPMAGLDLPTSRALYADLVRLNQTAGGPAIVLVSHDLDAARRHASHAVLLGRSGTHAGPAARVLVGERLAASYGVPADLFLPGGGPP